MKSNIEWSKNLFGGRVTKRLPENGKSLFVLTIYKIPYDYEQYSKMRSFGMETMYERSIVEYFHEAGIPTDKIESVHSFGQSRTDDWQRIVIIVSE
jgi:hypothetical protein